MWLVGLMGVHVDDAFLFFNIGECFFSCERVSEDYPSILLNSGVAPGIISRRLLTRISNTKGMYISSMGR